MKSVGTALDHLHISQWPLCLYTQNTPSSYSQLCACLLRRSLQGFNKECILHPVYSHWLVKC